MAKQQFIFKPESVCSKLMDITIEDGIVKNVDIVGGCSGNALGIKALVEGLPVDEVISKLKGIHCGIKSTSCPDQLARALEEHKVG